MGEYIGKIEKKAKGYKTGIAVIVLLVTIFISTLARAKNQRGSREYSQAELWAF